MSRIIKWVNSSQIHIMQVDPKTTNIFKQILKVKHEFDPNLSVFFFYPNPFILNPTPQKACWVWVVLVNRIKLCHPYFPVISYE